VYVQFWPTLHIRTHTHAHTHTRAHCAHTCSAWLSASSFLQRARKTSSSTTMLPWAFACVHVRVFVCFVCVLCVCVCVRCEYGTIGHAIVTAMHTTPFLFLHTCTHSTSALKSTAVSTHTHAHTHTAAIHIMFASTLHTQTFIGASTDTHTHTAASESDKAHNTSGSTQCCSRCC